MQTIEHPTAAPAAPTHKPRQETVVNDRRAVAMPERPAQPVATIDPGTLLQLALDRNADLDRLERLMVMKRDWDQEQAKKAYVAAMAQFKANPPTILKDKHVEFSTSKGITAYDHATLGNVTSAICAGLAQHGFSHRWNVEQADQITVTCTITHELGHSESVTMKAARDDSGGKNAIQQIASTVTYLQRYTLLSATGLAVQDGADDDGATAEGGPVSGMTEEHEEDVRARCEALGPTILGNVLREYKATALAEIPDSEYETIVAILDNMAKKRKPPAGAAK